jgi:type I restriction enzyme, S subunit
METTIRRPANLGKRPDQRTKELKAIDKRNWLPVTFGEVCRNVNETETDPVGKGLDRYVGLEHIETGSLHITRWGNISEGTTFTKKFAKGNVLFGKRRAYLKKAAVAEFDGLCSGDILVFEPIAKMIQPDLLPFLVSCDRFFDYAVKTSAGSLSPRTKFKDLANFEFLLPPLEEQARLAQLLWAGDEVVQKSFGCIRILNKIKYQYSISTLLNGSTENRVENITVPATWKILPIKECVDSIEYGLSLSVPDNADANGIPILTTAELNTSGYIEYDKIRKIKYDRGLSERTTLSTGDIVFNWRNSPELIGKSAIFIQPNSDSSYTYASFILRIRCDEKKSHNIYFKHLFNFYREIGIFLGLARKAVNQANFNKNEVHDLLVPVPPIKEQVRIGSKLEHIERQKSDYQNHIGKSKEIQKHLFDQIFSL